MTVPVRAHGTTGRVLARRYSMNERNVVRIIRLTAVFLALITPRAPKNGWCDPPMAASSCESAIIVWGVPHTMAPSFFFQAEDGIRDVAVTGVQTCALPI